MPHRHVLDLGSLFLKLFRQRLNLFLLLCAGFCNPGASVSIVFAGGRAAVVPPFALENRNASTITNTGVIGVS